mgnify:CR=1 FL=1
MEIQIEFGGFYGFHDEYIDCRMDNYGIDYDNIDWNDTFKNYAENWLHRFNMMSNLGLEFVSIDSPKYYNYRTDKIIAKVNDADINDLMVFVDYVAFYEWANPQLQSRSGFISFYNGIDDLIERAKDDDDDKAILLGMVCNYLIELNEVNEDIYELEYDIIELNDKLVENE